MNENEPKKPSWIEWPFKWIDGYGESTRRIIQNVISWAIVGALGLTIGYFWSNHDWLTQGSKSAWNLLKYPITLQAWVGLLVAVAVNWFSVLIYRAYKKRHERLSREVAERMVKEAADKRVKKIMAELSTQVPEPKNNEEPLNQIVDGRRMLLTGIVDIVNVNGGHDTIGALVQLADAIDSENDVKWICQELVKHNYKHPFEVFEIASDNALNGKWLKLLREARLANPPVKNDMGMLSFLTTKWSDKETWLVAKRRHDAALQDSVPKLPQDKNAAKETAMSDIKIAALTDCFSKLVEVTTAFKNYVCYMPDEEERAKNRNDYSEKMRNYENHLKTNLFVPPILKTDITNLLDEITRQVSHYIVGVETGARPMGYKEHAAFVKISDFAKDGCQVWLKKIEREFHQLLQPSGNVHADTINTVKTLYPKIKATKEAYDKYRQLMEPESREDDFKVLEDNFNNTWKYFSDNRLYLGETTSDCVYQLLQHIKASTTQFNMAMKEAEREPRDESTRGQLFDIHYKTDYNLQILYVETEKNFKQVLGVV